MNTDTPKFSVPNSVVEDMRVQTALAHFEQAQRTYLETRAPLVAHLDPLKQAKRLQDQITNATSADEIESASTELSGLMSPTAKLCQNRAAALARQAFGPLRASAAKLLETVACIGRAVSLITVY